MNFRECLNTQIKLHREIEPQDLLKMCYQASFGAEHLLSDVEGVEKYFYSEYESLEERHEETLWEDLSENICRVNMAKWKAEGLPAQWLFNMFLNSARAFEEGESPFAGYIDAAEEAVKSGQTRFGQDVWYAYIKEYKSSQMGPVHHSQRYRDEYRPAYRIVRREYLRIIPLLRALAQKMGKDELTVVAIDGRAASGKTTAAQQLKQIAGADIVQMDDFFLPMEMRSPDRMKEIGGNVHYERFVEEVLPYIKVREGFSYRRFDCSVMDYGQKRQVGSSTLRVVEGSYSLHPKLGDYADIKVFSDVSPKTQMERIIKRNGLEMAKRFETLWIPLEEEYFNEYKVSEAADIQLEK